MTVIYRFPNGLSFECRRGTSDYNTVNACGVQDEYELEGVEVADRLVFDLGAHIGGAAIRLASRGAHVVAVEPIPENVELILRNAALNGVTGRVTALQYAVGDPPELLLRYRWNGEGRPGVEEEVARVHAFIGNTGLGNEGFPANTEVWVPTVTLSALVENYGKPDVIKTDCEGGEWSIFIDPAIREVPLVVGEWHDLARGYVEHFENGQTRWVETESGYFFTDVERLLSPTHDVTFSGPDNGAGGFRAILRR